MTNRLKKNMEIGQAVVENQLRPDGRNRNLSRKKVRQNDEVVLKKVRHSSNKFVKKGQMTEKNPAYHTLKETANKIFTKQLTAYIGIYWVLQKQSAFGTACTGELSGLQQ